jgi:hypothetical protein
MRDVFPRGARLPKNKKKKSFAIYHEKIKNRRDGSSSTMVGAQLRRPWHGDAHLAAQPQYSHAV